MKNVIRFSSDNFIIESEYTLDLSEDLKMNDEKTSDSQTFTQIEIYFSANAKELSRKNQLQFIKAALINRNINVHVCTLHTNQVRSCVFSFSWKIDYALGY